MQFLAQSLPESSAQPGGWLIAALLALPLVGAGVCALAKSAGAARSISLATALVGAALAALLVIQVGAGPSLEGVRNFEKLSTLLGSQFAPDMLRLDGIPSFAFAFGVDAASVWLVALTCLLTPVALIASYGLIKERFSEYAAWVLVLHFALLAAFMARDVLLFYFMFELTLVPAFFLIAGWGGGERRRAASRFFVYTFAGSVFMLASILYVGVHAGTFEISAWTTHLQAHLTTGETRWVLLGLLAGLLVKVPLLPLHSWLPLAYTQAPAPVSALLSGAMAKLGTYGLLRLAMPGFIDSTGYTEDPTLLYVVSMLALAGIVVAALVAWLQTDFKTLQAYSSISHLGFCVLALCALSTLGYQASLLYMVNHGISSAGMFVLLGMIEGRMGTRDLNKVGGLGRGRPRLGFFFVLFVMSAIGLPLTNGFVSEFLAILSAARAEHLGIGVMVVAASGVVLGAVYMLHLTAKLIFGPARQPEQTATGDDLTGTEVAALLPLAVAVIALGVAPNLVLESSKSTLQLAATPIVVPEIERPELSQVFPHP